MGGREAPEGKFRKQIAQRPDLGACLRARAPVLSPGSPVASVADTFPSHSITGPLNTGGAGEAAAVPKGPGRAGLFTPEVRGDLGWAGRAGLAGQSPPQGVLPIFPHASGLRAPTVYSSAVKLRCKQGLEPGAKPKR